ncbi:MAG: 50S ribosomal protein L11 methyltransferase [Paracoccaceae bacterium]
MASGYRLDPAALPEPFATFAAALIAEKRPVADFVHLLETMAAKAKPRALVEYSAALRRAWPDHPLVHLRTGSLLASAVPGYHIPMITDEPRNRAYAEAIAAGIEPGMSVLEIGTGSGILALLAARAGAAHVYTVEINPTMAAIARRNISANGLGDRVTVIEANGLDLRIGETLPCRCDALVHELFGPMAVGESVLEILAHARTHLMIDSSLLLPDQVEIWGQIDGAASRVPALTNICGLNLSELGLLDIGYGQIKHDHELEALSAPTKLANIDLNLDFEPGSAIEVPVRITRDGDASAIVQWIGFRFPDGTVYRNPPGMASHWRMVRTRFARPATVRRGETRDLAVHIETNYLWYELAEAPARQATGER